MTAEPTDRARGIVLVIGSAPSATACRAWPRAPFTDIVAINNAWAVRPDWDHLIHPDDFPPERLPPGRAPGQRIVTAADYVPVQNRFGGVVYAGATMAFSAGYWALGALRPAVLAFFGCDMVYPATGPTHFYGRGAADPLRADVTLQSLAAKSVRLALLAARAGCHAVNLSSGETRLALPRATPGALTGLARTSPAVPAERIAAAEAAERRLGYTVPTGRYWEEADRLDPAALARIDHLWLAAASQPAGA